MIELNYERGAIDASDCVANAWELVKRQIGLYIGVCIVMMLLISCVPFVNLLLLGPVTGGFAYLVLRDMRDEPVDFGMLFKGFEKFVPLMIIGLLQAVPGIIFQVLQYSVDITKLFGGPEMAVTGSVGAMPYITTGLILFGVAYALISVIWSLMLVFAVPLIVEHDVSIGDAIRLSLGAVFSNLGGLILLMILGFAVMLLGMLAICFGLLVAIPVVYAANVFAYRMVFPASEADRNAGPPPPAAYGDFGRGI